MKVEVTIDLLVEMQGLEYETEESYGNVLDLFEEAIEGALKNMIEKSWCWSDWPVKDVSRISVDTNVRGELLGPDALEEE